MGKDGARELVAIVHEVDEANVRVTTPHDPDVPQLLALHGILHARPAKESMPHAQPRRART
ncbi:MAG TPA: hypothetical protein VFH78_00810 [Candidatus Thermoplasmatota archaeon]|nr:hypothetical protein [Candidatus Thermoplasmatota archaeon]